jgi:predicted Holliday junction resolvase-like endonuclease
MTNIQVALPEFLIFFSLLQLCVLIQYRKNIKKFRDRIKKVNRRADKMLSLKKSAEVRLGKIGENMAPFMRGWPYNPNNFRFLGHPVDGIQFTDDEIIFIEIKTGKSRLSKSQKKAREIIRKGNVSFATFRVDDKGIKLKKEQHVKGGSWKVEVV